MTAGLAWYQNERIEFLKDGLDTVVGQLSSAAIDQRLHIEPEQQEEWKSSVGLLQAHLDEKAQMVGLLQKTLTSPDLSDYEHVILEYDFRRRGLRLDCVLLGKGIIAVIEFKRSTVTPADRNQVTDYCVNLVEFHEETQRICGTEQCVIVPLLTLTAGRITKPVALTDNFHNSPWSAVLREPLLCDRKSLHDALRLALTVRRCGQRIDPNRWLDARFSPSSTIIDAAISLYGQHDVSSIEAHAAEAKFIQECTEEVAGYILESKQKKHSRIVFVSGAPGAGKTLVGLKLAFDRRFRKDAVFVTGNAPLVDVLTESLNRSYRSRRSGPVISGYAHEDAFTVIRMATFKIVKAHAFLGERGKKTGSADGSIVIFDEAQRAYQKGRSVLRKKLEDDEAALILSSLERTYGPGAVVVALLGHKQAINRGEMGVGPWFKAAKARGWRYAISDESLKLAELGTDSWAKDALRDSLKIGHLPHSLRFYRNSEIEKWADRVMTDKPEEAMIIANQLAKSNDTIWLTRDLATAKAWVRVHRVGDETAGMIASAQARRLAAVGLFVELKPDIANWVLAPAGDIRSSNMLETVQNQYQIQGLEIDYAIVCWDADLRRLNGGWESFQIIGTKWRKRSTLLEFAKNSYRVLLTRARKGMVLFVPHGDLSKEDSTRVPETYNQIAEYLLSCGARIFPSQTGAEPAGDKTP